MMLTTDTKDQGEFGPLWLLKWISPSLPIGSFTWSQGLETAVSRSFIKDRHSAQSWLEGSLDCLAWNDALALRFLHEALIDDDNQAFQEWDDRVQASRDTREAREEDREKALSLLAILRLSHDTIRPVASYPAAFALAMHLHDIPVPAALRGFCWQWLEGAVVTLTKLIPLGMRDSQSLLHSLIPQVEAVLLEVKSRNAEDFGYNTLGRFLVSAWHETEYCRIYRS